jgi:hypothetical protein
MALLEKKISANIHKFDLFCLIELLIDIGYPLEKILFKSHDSITSQPGLIHAITFQNTADRQVIITLNLGLLGVQSALPSYFQKKIHKSSVDYIRFVDFIGYFDNFLIKSYLFAIYPEINRVLFTDWESTKRRYLQMLDLKLCSTLHWLFQLVFPELGVKVEKAQLRQGMQIESIQLGKTVIGDDAVFGKKTTAPVYGRKATLISESDLTDPGEPWLGVIRQRLAEQIFPILGTVGIDMEIFLVIRAQKGWAKLLTNSYLGYDKIRGGQEKYRRILIFKGRISG